MLNKQALVALAACLTFLPVTLAEDDHKPPMAFCKEGTCNNDDGGCPAQITSSGDGYPACKVYTTDDVLEVGEFEAAEGGGTKVFMDIAEPDPGCTTIVRSPASTDLEHCGFSVGYYTNAVCAAITLKDSFVIQKCCGTQNCEDAGVTAPSKMIRGMDYKRGLLSRGVEIRGKDGKVIEPSQVGNPPQKKKPLARRGDDKDCKSYVPDGEVYTRPDDRTQILATGIDGGTGGSEITISHSREVSQSTTFSAGINIEVISASTEMTFETSITDTKEKKWTVPAGQTGKLGFTPNLKCTSGSLECKDGTSTGEACTGYKEADEIAGTYAIIAVS